MLEIRFSSNEIMRDIHNAIKGTPGYINNEIIVNAEDNYLLIGENNDNNLVIDLSDWIMTKYNVLGHSVYSIDRFA